MTKYSICITTFKEREDLVKRLINDINRLNADINLDIIVIINGNNEEQMDDRYRCRMLEFCATIKNCYPIVCPEFKSLAKLWNTLVIFSNTEYNLILNDDILCNNDNTLNMISKAINQTKYQFFTINGGFSHFVITKTMLHNLGYFDERLIAFGEEDGDIVHRYILKYGDVIAKLMISDFGNICAYNKSSTQIETHVDNKPRFNREFVMQKYVYDSNGVTGMSPTPQRQVLADNVQYPYEMFVRYNKHNIKAFDKIINKYD